MDALWRRQSRGSDDYVTGRRQRTAERAPADLIVPLPKVRSTKGGSLLLTTTARDSGV